MIEGNCLYCNKGFTSTQSKRRYCSDSCKVMYLRQKNNPGQLLNKICENCGEKYRGTHSSKYCSKECGLQDKKCFYCNDAYKGHFNSKFCSTKCKDAYKVRKPTGEFEKCLVCNNPYEVTYGKKRNKKQVCSVKCANILATSKSGEIVSLEQIEEILKNVSEQPPVNVVADLLNTSNTTILTRAKESYGSYREMVVQIRGSYTVSEQDKSFSANTLFSLIDEMYNIVGIREKTFTDLVNPKTGIQLRVDYFITELPLAIEYHGIQHYQEVEFFDKGDLNSFKERQIRDIIKETYLKDKSIPLVIFNYQDQINETTIRSKLDKYLK